MHMVGAEYFQAQLIECSREMEPCVISATSSSILFMFLQPLDWISCVATSALTIDASGGWVALSIALLALAAMEIVLGIDNVIFISIVTSRLPQHQQRRARLIGLSLALIFRILLLCCIASIASWTEPIFRLDDLLSGWLQTLTANSQAVNEVSVRDLILLIGGLFLVVQSVREMIHLTEARDQPAQATASAAQSFGKILIQIVLLDIVFSLDSVITAVGMVDNVAIMITAVVIAVLVMMLFSEPVSAFVLKHSSIKVLALAFLLMIGVMLIAEGLGTHFNKSYIYFAMAFALSVELVNLRVGRS